MVAERSGGDEPGPGPDTTTAARESGDGPRHDVAVDADGAADTADDVAGAADEVAGTDDTAGTPPPDAASETGARPTDVLAERADGTTGRLAARLLEHLDADERVRLCWSVVRREPPTGTAGAVRRDDAADTAGAVRRDVPAATAGTVRRTVYAATDRRLLAVETDRSVRSTPFARRSVGDPALTLGAGVVAAVLSFLGAVAAPTGWTALLLVVTCVGGVALAELGWRRLRAVGDRHDRAKTAVSSVVVGDSPASTVGEGVAMVGEATAMVGEGAAMVGENVAGTTGVAERGETRGAAGTVDADGGTDATATAFDLGKVSAPTGSAGTEEGVGPGGQTVAAGDGESADPSS